MMKRQKILLLLPLFWLACKKETRIVPSTSRLCFVVAHHSAIVPEAEVYMVYNVSAFPGWETSSYTQHIMADAAGSGCFENVPLGTHYLMVIGYDESIQDDVVGNLAVKITNTGETVSVEIPVSE